MKNKKGFTLVELIVVIAILAVILFLIVPNIVDMFNNGKKDAFIRQVQSVWRDAEKEHAMDYTGGVKEYIYSDSISNIGRKLKLSKNNLTYVTGFDLEGDLSYIAVGDKNYCYIVSEPDKMDILRENIVEGLLSCSSTSCTCGDQTYNIVAGGPGNPGGNPGGSTGGNNSGNTGGSTGSSKYVYWDYNILVQTMDSIGRSSGYYANNEYPIYAVTDYNLLQQDVFIRTTLDNYGNVEKHDACFKKNGNILCVDDSYYFKNDSNGINEVVYGMRSLFNQDFYSDNGYDVTYIYPYNQQPDINYYAVIGRGYGDLDYYDNIVTRAVIFYGKPCTYSYECTSYKYNATCFYKPSCY